MPVPRQVTKEFFVPNEYSFLDSDNDPHIIDELPPPRNDQEQIDNLLYLFDLLDESLSRTNNITNNQSNNDENTESNIIEDKEINDDEIFDDSFDNIPVNSNISSNQMSTYQQTMSDLDDLEDLLTELFILTSGRRVNTDDNSQQALQVYDDYDE